METEKEIVGLFVRNEMDPEVRDAFSRWMTDPTDAQKKEQALRDVWEEMPSDTDADLPAASDVFKRAKALEKASAGTYYRKSFLLPGIVAAACLALVALVPFLFRPRQVTTLASSEEAKSRFELPDGSTVWLNADSRLTYTGRLDGRTRSVTIDGEGYFDVAKDPAHPFIVRTSDMDITVLGTRFTVSAYAGKHVSAYLEEGSIRVKGRDFPEVWLEPGQCIAFDDNTLRWSKSVVPVANHTAWIRPQLEFGNTSLGDILENLSHWYNLSFRCTDTDFLRDTRLSMTIRQEPVEEILDAISALTGLQYTWTDDSILLSR